MCSERKFEPATGCSSSTSIVMDITRKEEGRFKHAIEDTLIAAPKLHFNDITHKEVR